VRLLQSKKARAKFLIGFSLACCINGFAAVFIAIVNIDTANTVAAMIILSISAVVLGGIIVAAIIAGVFIRLSNDSLEYLAKGDLAKGLSVGAKTKQSMFPPPHGQDMLAFCAISGVFCAIWQYI